MLCKISETADRLLSTNFVDLQILLKEAYVMQILTTGMTSLWDG
ncbi:hypothetical protein [uncultured Proteiniphilum sp.]|nr:hypothetical protein [uncultured Proteiniphilum sp.]